MVGTVGICQGNSSRNQGSWPFCLNIGVPDSGLRTALQFRVAGWYCLTIQPNRHWTTVSGWFCGIPQATTREF